MDPKTKALLHTSGAVLASENPHHMVTDFTVFPPAASMSVSHHMLHHPSMGSGDKKVLIAQLAKMIGKSVAHAVEEQILKAYEMDAKSALALIYDAKKSFYENQATQFFPASNDVFAMPEAAMKPWPKVTGESILNDIKAALQVIQENKPSHASASAGTHDFGGILDINAKTIWDPAAFLSHGVVGGSYASVEPEFEPPNVKHAPANEITKVFHDLIPGFSTMRQACPVDKCGWQEKWTKAERTPFLQQTIIHINDHHKWTREAIAEWLETLDHDLTFKTPDEVVKPMTEVQEGINDEQIKALISQPLLTDPELIKELMGTNENPEEVNNGNHS